MKTKPQPGPGWQDIVKPGRGYRPRRRFPRGLGRTVFITGMFMLIAALIAGGLFAYFIVHPPGRHVDAELANEQSGQPINVLLLGSDSREGLSKEELKKYDPEGTDRKTGRRADTIMLLHLDPDREKATIVSFPRDLRVKKPDGSIGKINSVYQKGPQAMIDEVSSYSGLPIQHFVEVNFAGFKNIVNTVGGVDVYFEKAFRDSDSGLNVPSGCVHVTGDQALAFVRVRHIDSDFGRIARQQLFIKLMMKKVTSAGTLLNPVKVVKLINLFSENVKTDDQLSVGFVKELATKLKGFSSDQLDMRQVPAVPQNIKGVSFVIANEEQTTAIFSALKDRKPLPDYGRTGISALTPKDVRISVLNGSGVAELAKKEATKLKGFGYATDEVSGELPTGNASPHAETTVYFKQGNEEKAAMVAGMYGAQVLPMPSSIEVETEIALVLGQDFAEGKATPPPPSPQPTKPKKAATNPLVTNAIHECPKK